MLLLYYNIKKDGDMKNDNFNLSIEKNQAKSAVYISFSIATVCGLYNILQINKCHDDSSSICMQEIRESNMCGIFFISVIFSIFATMEWLCDFNALNNWVKEITFTGDVYFESDDVLGANDAYVHSE